MYSFLAAVRAAGVRFLAPFHNIRIFLKTEMFLSVFKKIKENKKYDPHVGRRKNIRERESTPYPTPSPLFLLTSFRAIPLI